MVKELSEMAPGSLDSQCLKLMIVLSFPPSLYCSLLALSFSLTSISSLPFPPFALLTDLLNAFQRILVQVCIVTCSKIIIQALMSRRANTFFLLFQ